MLQPTRLISTPFAQEGEKTEIQNVTGEFDNSATYRLGFPPLTMQSIRLGGKPPKGTDFNGVLFDITENISFLCKGGRYQYNAGLSTLIGGYPEGSNLLLDDNVTEVVSTVAGNQNNPNINMTGWILKPNRTTAEYVLDASGETQQQVNYNGGSKWHSRVGGYLKNERVVISNGDIVKSTVDGNVNDPNVDMTGWVNPESEQREINNTLMDRTRLVDDYGADPEGVLDSAAAFNASLSASGYLNLRDGGVYIVKSALTRDGFLMVGGDAEIIFDFDGDGLLVNASNQSVDLGAVSYNGASHLGRKRRSVVRVNNSSEVTANHHKIINVYNDTDSVLALYLFEYGDSELKNGTYKNITGLGNGVIGDAIGAIRAVYGSGNIPCGDLKITGGHAENINTVDIGGVSILEDADAFVTQTTNKKASLIVTNVSYKNVGKRLVKTQTSVDSLTSVDGCHGASAWISADPNDANNKGMYSIASAYLGTLMFTKNSLIGGFCNYMIETSGNVDVIEFGNVFKPSYSAQIQGAHTRPYLHSSASNSRIIHALSIVDNVARGSNTSSSNASQIDVANIVDHKVLGAELWLKNHVSLGNVLKGGGLNSAILYQYAIEQFSVSSNIIRDWQDGVYVKAGISTAKLAGSVTNNVSDNISRNLVSEFEPAAVGKVGVSGNYSTIPSSGSKYSMLANTPTAPTITAGGAPALPATPFGYMSVTLNGVQRYIPIYS